MNPDTQITRWLTCPECGDDDVTMTFNNGRIRLTCESCLEGQSKLVGRATFR